jgi:hypothetical protein
MHSDTITVTSTTAGITGSPLTIPVSVNAIEGPAISTASLASGTAGTAYSQTLAATGGQTPYAWSIVSGALCTGLSLNASTGAITGTPALPGSCAFTARVTDDDLATDDQALSITVAGVPNVMTRGGVVSRGGAVKK